MMDPTLIVVTFVISWTIALFFVLPIGIDTAQAPDPLHAPGAPIRANVPRKMLWAAGIAVLATVAIAMIWDQGWISFR